jgi:POT family proton-dependent oligopeptide transporter
MATAVAAVPGSQKTFLGHPRGLYVLFFTEMWERFSYYGMRALLVLYMVRHLFLYPDVGQRVLGFTVVRHALESVFGTLAIQPLSSQIYGLYTAFVYLTPLFGGMLADRVLGQRRTVILGAVLMAIGHFLMASEHFFFLALMCLILGNGAFKPNISTQVGSLYPEGDPRRDGAFTIFYMGINIGAFGSPLVCGTLGQTIGWHWGFGAAGVGMVLGLILYLWGQPLLGKEPSSAKVVPSRVAKFIVVYIVSVVALLLALVVGLPLVLGMMAIPVRMAVLGVAGVILVGSFLRWLFSLPRDERMRVGSLTALIVPNIVFWGCYEEQGNVMQLWADANTNWRFFGWTMPSTWYQAFNPFMIFAFAPLLNVFWAWQARRGKEPLSVTKLAIGCLLLGLSYIVMIFAAHGVAPDAKRSVMWLVGMTFVVTIGELYLSPVGLSLVTKVAPARIVSMMMGMWFLQNFFGNYLTGYLGTFWEKMPKENFFALLSGLGIVAAIVIFLISRPIVPIMKQHDRPGAA